MNIHLSLGHSLLNDKKKTYYIFCTSLKYDRLNCTFVRKLLSIIKNFALLPNNRM